MAKAPKALSSASFAQPKPFAFRLLPTKDNFLRVDEKFYYFLTEFRGDIVVCYPVGDYRYAYYMPLTAFDPKDYIQPDVAPPPIKTEASAINIRVRKQSEERSVAGMGVGSANFDPKKTAEGRAAK